MSDGCWNPDNQVRLFEFTIVSLKRDDERILKHGERLVRDPMSEEEFKVWVIADYVRCHHLPCGEDRYLRVVTRHLGTWDKQPLHFESRQLGILQEISDKIGPPIVHPHHHDHHHEHCNDGPQC